MKAVDNTFIWSDNWWIDRNKAWFVSGIQNILFCLDLDTHMCESAVMIPDKSKKKFRVTPFCIKYGKDIFCLPGFGEYIWVYNLVSEQFMQIKVENPHKNQLWFDFWVHENKIWAISRLTNKLLEIDPVKKEVQHYHIICGEDVVSASIMVDHDLYCLSNKLGRIYQYNLLSKSKEIYEIPDINKKLATICYDGKRFWISGYCKEIYVWEKTENSLIKIDDFPKNFGVYNFGKTTGDVLDCEREEYELPTFSYLLSMGKFVWFIPYETNMIMYADKQTYRLKVFEIEGESETRESVLAWHCALTGFRYVVEYTKDNRYIGLFSTKSGRILEIDTHELKYRWKEYSFSEKCLRQCAELNGKIYHEEKIIERKIYEMLIYAEKNNVFYDNKSNTGVEIYRKTLG